MILYFSGTGNSEYIAKTLAHCIQDTTLNLFEKLKNNDQSELHSTTPYVIVAPTYGWQLPHFVRDWLKQVPLSGNQHLYFLLTCGSDNGNASKHVKQLCDEISMTYQGCAEIVMPENYIAMFDVPSEDEIPLIIQQAKQKTQTIAQYILENQRIPEKKSHPFDSLKSGLVNQVFYKFFVHAKPFYATDACVGCGKCEQVCVCNNIQIVNHQPQWGNRCTHCMACICKCPMEAIEYGKASKNKPRYQCPKEME